MTYEEMGLDQFLRSIDSPSRDNVGWANRGSVRNTILRNSSITDAKIDSLNANKINAGTIDVYVSGSAIGGTISGTAVALEDLTPEEIASGTYSNTMNVGTASTGYVRIDGGNNRIIVNDGTTNRIVIGNV